MQAHAGSVSSLSLSEDEWVLASAGRDSTVAFWDFRHHTKLSSIPVLEPVEGAVVLPSSSTLPRPAKKARTSGAMDSGWSNLRIATAGSGGHLKVSSTLPISHLALPPGRWLLAFFGAVMSF